MARRPNQVSIPNPEFGVDFDASARAMHQSASKGSLMVHETAFSMPAVARKSLAATLFERNTMLKTLKRKIALVAVAAISATGLTVMSSPVANAAAGAAPAAVTGSIETLRKDDVAYDDVIGVTGTAVQITATETAAGDFITDKVKVGYKSTASATEILISTVASGAAPAAAATQTVALATGVNLQITNAGAGTGTLGTPTAGVYTIANAGAANTAHTVVLNLGRNAIPGIYTLYVGTAAGTYTSDAVTVTNAPSAITVFAAGSTTTSSSTLTGDGTKNYDIKVTDGSRATYLLASERVDLTVSGGSGSGVTVTTPGLASLGSGDITSATANANYAATLTAATATGTYTLTAAAAGWTATSATGTLIVVSTANVKNATKLELTTTPATGTTGVVATVESDSTAAAASANLGAAQGVAGASNFVPTSARSLTFKATFAAGTTGDAAFTVSGSTITGITAGTVNLVPIGADATASITYTASNANNAEAIWVTVTSAAANAGEVLELATTYENQAIAKVTISPDTANLAAKTASVVSLTAKVVNQFGVTIAGNATTLTTTGGSRNASKTLTELTDATGVATFSYTDTSTSTVNLQDAVTITAAGGITDAITINFGGDTTPATMAFVVSQPATPGTTATYDTAITAATAPSVTVDVTLGAANGNAQTRIADQVQVAATVKNAAGTNVSGVPVVWTGTDGVFFVDGAGPTDVPATATLLAVNTVTNYTNAGVVNVEAVFTKIGTATITATSGTVKTTWSITVKAGSNAIITATAAGAVVTAKVTDLWGNAVAGTTVSFTAATGATLGAGTSSISGVTNVDGVVTAVVSAVTAGSYVVTVAHTGGDSAVTAVTATGVGAGVASANATATVAATGSSSAATDTAISAVKADVKAVSDTVATLSKAVTTIQSSVTELTSSFSAQIKSLSSAIAKISRAIAALSKKIK